MSGDHPVHFECADPILSVKDLKAAVHYYVEVLGFREAEWGYEDFTCVTRDRAGIYLCQGGQGHPGAWVWVGVSDAEALYQELKERGAHIHQPPRNYPWALEMHVEDLDGNILRMGSDTLSDRPYDEWQV